MTKTTINALISGFLYVLVFWLYRQNPAQRNFTEYKKNEKIEVSGFQILKDTIDTNSRRFGINMPNQWVDIRIFKYSVGSKIFIDKWARNAEKNDVLYYEHDDKLLLQWNNIRSLKWPRREYDFDTRIKVIADSITFLKVDKYSNVYFDGGFSKNGEKVKIEVEEGASLELKNLDVDTLILYSKCYSKIEIQNCDIGFLDHTVHGGNMSSTQRSITNAKITKINDLPCNTEYDINVKKVLTANLSNDPNTTLIYKSRTKPRLTNFQKSTVIKLCR
jgi:hypothetical protein